MIAYICEQGAKIRKEGRRLIVETKDGKNTLFMDDLEQVLLFGNVQLTAPALLLLLKKNIDTVFLRYDGRFMGRLTGEDGANVFLRKKQFLLTEDKTFCLNVARAIVHAKLMNQATVITRIRRKFDNEDIGIAAVELKILAKRALVADELATCRGIEGRGAAIYFKHLPFAFSQDWGFTRRVRQPPTDPVNAVLSLLYTILTNRCYAAARIAGLDPAPGCLHALVYGRFSLPLDLVEEFRAIFVDTLTVALFNNRMLKFEDFESSQEKEETNTAANMPADPFETVLADPLNACQSVNAQTMETEINEEEMSRTPKTAFILRAEALKKVLTAFSRKMETRITHPLNKQQMSYAEAIIFQARQYKMLVEGKINAYEPIIFR